MTPHPNLDGAAASLQVLARLDLDGRALALVEATTWALVEVPADVAAAAVPGTWWFGEPVGPASVEAEATP